MTKTGEGAEGVPESAQQSIGESVGSVSASVQQAAPQDGHGQGWPVCRCGHPMHPTRLETRRGIPMERFECPKHRWWNHFWHPVVWEAPRS